MHVPLTLTHVDKWWARAPRHVYSGAGTHKLCHCPYSFLHAHILFTTRTHVLYYTHIFLTTGTHTLCQCAYSFPHTHTRTYSLLHAHIGYTNGHIDELGVLDTHEREGKLGGNRLSMCACGKEYVRIPMYMLMSSGPLTLMKERAHSVATALASSVFPVPY